MALTTIATAGTYDKGLVVAQWSKKVTREYIKEEELSPWSSSKPGAIFHYKQDLTAKPGNSVTFALVGKLTGAGATGDNTLTPDALGNYADTVEVDQLRKGVARGEHEQSKTEIDILMEAKFMLKEWLMEQLRDLKVARMACPHLDGVTTFASASEASRDAHLTANNDRYLFGALKSNTSAGDHSASLLNVDTTADTLDRGIISKAKRMAETASPLIGPTKTKGVRQHYVAFCGSDPHRDLKADLDAVHQTAAPREKGMTNPVWKDDDLVYEDVVVRKVPSMASLGNLGAASAPIHQVAFCGRQAVCVAWGKHVRPIRNGPEGEDWGNQIGRGVAETRGAKKTTWNDKQHGLLTVYVAAEADT